MKIIIDFKELKENPLFEREKAFSKTEDDLNFDPNLSFKSFNQNTVNGIFLRLLGCNLRLNELDEFYAKILYDLKINYEIKDTKYAINQQSHHKKTLSENPVFTGIASNINTWNLYKNDFSDFVVKFFVNLKNNKEFCLSNYQEIDKTELDKNKFYSDWSIYSFLNKLYSYKNKDLDFNIKTIKENKDENKKDLNSNIEMIKNDEDKKDKKVLDFSEDEILLKFLNKIDKVNNEFYNVFKQDKNKKFKKININSKENIYPQINLTGIIFTYLARLYVLNNEGKREELLVSNGNSSLKGITPDNGNFSTRTKDYFTSINETQKRIKRGKTFYVKQKNGELIIDISGEEKILKLIKKLIDLQDIKYIPVGHGMGEIKSVLL